VADKHPPPREPVPSRAMLRWPDHPSAVCAADQIADCGHIFDPKLLRPNGCDTGGAS
jgi:hypothetical protein